MYVLVGTTLILVAVGVALLRVPDSEGEMQAFGAIALAVAALTATMCAVEVYRRRRGS